MPKGETGEGLQFLWTSADGARTVWVSGTTAGVACTCRCLPLYSNGNGGTHILYSGDDCLLDTQNQINGFVFPPNIVPLGITRPPLKPATYPDGAGRRIAADRYAAADPDHADRPWRGDAADRYAA